MKKSEMIENIFEASMKDLGGLKVQGNEKKIIEYILDKAEELGMLPPQKDDGRDVFLWSYVGDSFEWEPEDEEKENE